MAQGTSGLAQLTRKVKPETEEEIKLKAEKAAKAKTAESGRKYISFRSLREAVIDRASRSARMVIITEGLGNKRDLRYYGPEAIASVARLINGAKCYINHKTAQQEIEQPEGSIWSLAGYWKSGIEQMVDGMHGVVATLCFNESETGEAAMKQCEHALKYAADFPGSAEVYCGTSINGDGAIEVRRMLIGGVEMDVNYVTEVTDLPSADLVTQPARGGRVMSMIESIRGCRTRQEAKAMAGKNWFSLLTGLLEAVRGGKADEKLLTSVVTEADKMKAAEEADEEARKKKEAEEAAAEALRGSEDEGKEGNDGTDDEEVPPTAAGAVPGKGGKKTSVIKHEERHVVAGESAKDKKIRDLEKKLAEATAAKETPAIEALIKESGMKVTAKDVLAMNEADRKVVLAMLESMRDTFTATGETARGSGGTTPSGKFHALAESVGVRARGR